MFKNHTDIWQFLAVEVAVKISELLNRGDWPYEYMSEANELSTWLKLQPQLKARDIEDKLSSILSSSLEHEYPPESFAEIAMLVESRLDKFTERGVRLA